MVRVYLNWYLGQPLNIYCYGQKVAIKLPEELHEFELGAALFTRVGSELSSICGSTPSLNYLAFMLDKWKTMRYIVSY